MYICLHVCSYTASYVFYIHHYYEVCTISVETISTLHECSYSVFLLSHIILGQIEKVGNNNTEIEHTQSALVEIISSA